MKVKPFDSFLPPAECGQARTPDELHEWSERKFKDIGATDAGKTAIRLKVGRLKRFVDEIYPLAVFGQRFLGGKPGVRLQWLEGNANRDALLIDSSTATTTVTPLEIVYAGDGHDESLRMEYMEEHGGVDLNGKITKVCEKGRRRKVFVESTAINRQTFLHQKLGHIQKALAQKCTKPYPPETVLLVALDDSRLMERGDLAEVRRAVVHTVEELKPPFSDLYVFGFTGYIAQHFPLRLTP